MLSEIFDYMPLFIVRWFALRNCEVSYFLLNGERFVQARPGVLFKIEQDSK